MKRAIASPDADSAPAGAGTTISNGFAFSEAIL